MYIHPLLALFTLDVAAPVELALALGDAQDRGRVVTSAAADNVATVRAERRLVAFPTRCPQRACKKSTQETESIEFFSYSGLNKIYEKLGV